jgi:hypothetical protein
MDMYTAKINKIKIWKMYYISKSRIKLYRYKKVINKKTNVKQK